MPPTPLPQLALAHKSRFLDENGLDDGRTHGLDVAEQKRQLLLELPVQLEPVREPLVWRAARLEALYSLSSADTFAAALALALKTHLVTGDPEFEPIRLNEGLKVRWISRADKA